MMHWIATKIQNYTGALKIPPTADGSQESGRILDLCMAPGGFLGTAMKLNPGSEAVAFSLPTSKGGHDILLESVEGFNVNETRFLDITMLAADIMGVSRVLATAIPISHPDADNFVTERQLDQTETFDLVLCDGQVLRNHERASYREGLRRESIRMLMSQVILGLRHLRPGGTMVVLLHKLEAWDTVQILYEFSKFSSVRLFKSKKSHAIRSSFYMIASKVQSQSDDAQKVVAKWQCVWKLATFVLDDDSLRSMLDFQGHLDVERVLQEFGEDLIRLGNGVWSIQPRH